jgi:hypothetical protein
MCSATTFALLLPTTEFPISLFPLKTFAVPAKRIACSRESDSLFATHREFGRNALKPLREPRLVLPETARNQ